MSLTCPKCRTRINPLRVQAHFICPSCASALAGKINGPIFAAMALSTIADFIIYPVVYSVAGTDWWPGFTLRISISGAVFIFLVALLVGEYGSVEAKDETQTLP